MTPELLKILKNLKEIIDIDEKINALYRELSDIKAGRYGHINWSSNARAAEYIRMIESRWEKIEELTNRRANLKMGISNTIKKLEKQMEERCR